MGGADLFLSQRRSITYIPIYTELGYFLRFFRTAKLAKRTKCAKKSLKLRAFDGSISVVFQRQKTAICALCSIDRPCSFFVIKMSFYECFLCSHCLIVGNPPGPSFPPTREMSRMAASQAACGLFQDWRLTSPPLRGDRIWGPE